MRKSIAAIFLILVSLCHTIEAPRNFLIGYLSGYYDKNITNYILPSKYLDIDFDNTISEFKEAIKEDEDDGDYEVMYEKLKELSISIKNEFPIEDILSIIYNFSMNTDSKAIQEAVKVLSDEYTQKSQNATTKGYCFGKMTKILNVEKNNNHNINLMSSDGLYSDILFEFFLGVLDGLTIQGGSACKKDIINNKEIVESLLHAFPSLFKYEFSVLYSNIMNILSQLLQIGGALFNCRFVSLVESIKNIVTLKTIDIIKLNFSNNIPVIIKEIENIIQYIAINNYIQLGASIGKLIKIVFDFYVY